MPINFFMIYTKFSRESNNDLINDITTVENHDSITNKPKGYSRLDTNC